MKSTNFSLIILKMFIFFFVLLLTVQICNYFTVNEHNFFFSFLFSYLFIYTTDSKIFIFFFFLLHVTKMHDISLLLTVLHYGILETVMSTNKVKIHWITKEKSFRSSLCGEKSIWSQTKATHLSDTCNFFFTQHMRSSSKKKV